MECSKSAQNNMEKDKLNYVEKITANKYKIYLYYIYGYLLEEECYDGELTKEDIVKNRDKIIKARVTYQDKKALYNVIREWYSIQKDSEYISGYEIQCLMGVVEDKAIEKLLIKIKEKSVDKLYNYSFKLEKNDKNNEVKYDRLSSELLKELLNIGAIKERVYKILENNNEENRWKKAESEIEQLLKELSNKEYQEDIKKGLEYCYKVYYLSRYEKSVEKLGIIQNILGQIDYKSMGEHDKINFIINMIMENKALISSGIHKEDIEYIMGMVKKCYRQWKGVETSFQTLIDVEYDIYLNYNKLLKIKDSRLNYYQVDYGKGFKINNQREVSYTKQLFDGLYISEKDWIKQYYIYVDTLKLMIEGNYTEQDVCSILRWKNDKIEDPEVTKLIKSGSGIDDYYQISDKKPSLIKGEQNKNLKKLDARLETFSITVNNYLRGKDEPELNMEHLQRHQKKLVTVYNELVKKDITLESIVKFIHAYKKEVENYELEQQGTENYEENKKALNIIKIIVDKTKEGIESLYGIEIDTDNIYTADIVHIREHIDIKNIKDAIEYIPKYLIKSGYIKRVQASDKDMERLKDLILQEYSRRYMRLRGRDKGKGYISLDEINVLNEDERLFIDKVYVDIYYKDIEMLKLTKYENLYKYTFKIDDEIQSEAVEDFIKEKLYKILGHKLPDIPYNLVKEVTERELTRLDALNYKVENSERLNTIIIDELELHRMSKEPITDEEIVKIIQHKAEGYSKGLTEDDKKLVQEIFVNELKALCVEYSIPITSINLIKVTNEINKVDYNQYKTIYGVYEDNHLEESIKGKIREILEPEIKYL